MIRKLLIVLSLTGLLPMTVQAQLRDTVANSDTTTTLVIPKTSGSDTLVLMVQQGIPQIAEVAPQSVSEAAPDIKRFFSFGKIFWALIVILGGYLIIRSLVRMLELLGAQNTSAHISVRNLLPMVQIFGWIFVVYVVLVGVMRPPMATLLAGAASLGIAVGFAGQDIVKNIFGGITILFDRPFRVGDKIEVGNFYGKVTQIGLRSTRIVTPDDSLVSIPNGELMNQAVSNSNAGENNCLVVAEIYLPLSIDTAQVREIATEAAKVSKYIYLNKPIAVLFFNEVKGVHSYYKMRLKAYVMNIGYEFAFKSDMTELVISALLKEGVIEAGRKL